MSNDETVELHKLLFDPYKLYSPGYLDGMVKGAMNTQLERMDNYFNKEVRIICYATKQVVHYKYGSCLQNDW